jgi:hypothetical protein
MSAALEIIAGVIGGLACALAGWWWLWEPSVRAMAERRPDERARRRRPPEPEKGTS